MTARERHRIVVAYLARVYRHRRHLAAARREAAA